VNCDVDDAGRTNKVYKAAKMYGNANNLTADIHVLGSPWLSCLSTRESPLQIMKGRQLLKTENHSVREDYPHQKESNSQHVENCSPQFSHSGRMRVFDLYLNFLH
jgi:hypothetical protein